MIASLFFACNTSRLRHHLGPTDQNPKRVPAGIWHTGIIVYGKEYFFGGGLQSMAHEVFVQMHGGARPVEYIDLGATDIPQVCT